MGLDNTSTNPANWQTEKQQKVALLQTQTCRLVILPLPWTICLPSPYQIWCSMKTGKSWLVTILPQISSRCYSLLMTLAGRLPELREEKLTKMIIKPFRKI